MVLHDEARERRHEHAVAVRLTDVGGVADAGRDDAPEPAPWDDEVRGVGTHHGTDDERCRWPPRWARKVKEVGTEVVTRSRSINALHSANPLEKHYGVSAQG